MAKWIKCKTPGVRYREHTCRKHGVRADRYFSIRYKLAGKDKEEALGWASAGWTEQKAAEHLAELKKAHRTGDGERTLSEKRAKADKIRQEKEQLRQVQEKESITFGQVFEEHYWPHVKSYKTARVIATERSMYDKWMKADLANKSMKGIVPFHLEKIRKTLRDAGRSPRTQDLPIAMVRQVYNFALGSELYMGTNPAHQWKEQAKLKGRTQIKDAKRVRFLTEEEAATLLGALKKASRDVYDAALLSLYTGMRAGEIFTLTWSNVDFNTGILTLLDTKNGKTRAAYLTDRTTRMMQRRFANKKENDLVFPARGGNVTIRISNTYRKVVKDLGLNDGITDSRQKIVFHTLRHTFASWLVQQGTDLYTVKELMGHKSLAMTERYAHLAPEGLRAAVNKFDQGKRGTVALNAICRV